MQSARLDFGEAFRANIPVDYSFFETRNLRLHKGCVPGSDAEVGRLEKNLLTFILTRTKTLYSILNLAG